MPLFIDILNIVLPVFFVIALGYLLKRLELIDDNFVHQTNRLVYYVALPLLLFYGIGTADFAANFNVALVLASAATIAAGFCISYGYAALRGYPPAVRGTFSQGAFRGNLAYVGLAIVMTAYGQTGFARAGILMGFLVPVLNFFAIASLLLPHRGSGRAQGESFWPRQMLLNPLVIASFAGILWSFLHLRMPVILERSLKITTGMSLPLALLAIGGSFSLAKLRGDLLVAGLAASMKLLLLPLIAAVFLIAFGVKGQDLGIGVLLAATPTATASYIMAHQMKGDPKLAGSIVMLSTLLSIFSYVLILYLLRSMGT